ncbi:MAG: hypothetical protein K6G53_03985 [Bacteroidales bacterium]|nr:hypothetical protein [Bacteroidales bacterium]
MKLSKTYAALLKKLRRRNAFLAEHVDYVRNHNQSKQRFALAHGRVMIEAMLATRSIDKIQEGNDLGRHPELFWELADYMKCKMSKKQSAIGLDGLATLYEYSYTMGYIGEEFDEHRLPIREHLRQWSFMKAFFRNGFERSDLTHLVKYRKTARGAFVTVKYRGAYLQDITLRHFEVARRKNLRSRDYVQFVINDAGAWLDGLGDPINTVEDLTTTKWSQAISHFKIAYEGARRCDALRYLFDIYQLAITENPDHNFFSDSYLWCREMVFDFHLPYQLAHGYELVPVGTADIYPAYEKVIFVFDKRYYKIANSHRLALMAHDYSSIKTEYYRLIIINYGAHNSCKRVENVLFFQWLEQRKMNSGTYETNLKHVDRKEAYAYRAFVFKAYQEPETRNTKLGSAKAYLRWAVENGYMTADQNIWECFNLVRTRIKSITKKTHCLTNVELVAIETTLEMMAANDVRALLALHLFRIQLFVETRAGELCDITLSNLQFNRDGSCTYFAPKQKNSGKDSVEVLFPPTATQAILDVIEITAETRASCPLSCADNLFIYETGHIHAGEFMVLSVEAYNIQLKKASRIAGLHIEVLSSHVRDTYMTTMKRFCHEHGLTELQRMVLVKHNRRSTINYYLDINRSDFLTKANRLTFGKILK